jgi:general stress protein 26
MDKPELKPIGPTDLVSFAVETMKDAKFPTLASMDGDQARVRPVSPVRTDGFTVYVANLKMYHKTQEIAVNPKVELCYLAEDHNQVRITGEAKILSDRGLLEEIWEANPLLRKYLGSIENPALVVYRIEPKQVRYMVEWALEYYDVPLA